MSSAEALQARVAELLRKADSELQVRRRAREDLMEEIGPRKALFDELASRLLTDAVRPRLEVLLLSFDHAGPIVELGGGHGLAVSFARTTEFPAHARIEVSITHDVDYTSAKCACSPAIIPILMDYERDLSLDIDLQSPDVQRLEAFLDQRIERFVASYLSIRAPESVYQKDLLVTDPVCGMTLRRVDALPALDQGGRTVYFCADTCRRQFESAPHRHGTESALASDSRRTHGTRG